MVDSGIRAFDSSYQRASLCSKVGRYDNPMPESTVSPLSGTKNLVTAVNET
jgi:hypothetical protein